MFSWKRHNKSEYISWTATNLNIIMHLSFNCETTNCMTQTILMNVVYIYIWKSAKCKAKESTLSENQTTECKTIKSNSLFIIENTAKNMHQK